MIREVTDMTIEIVLLASIAVAVSGLAALLLGNALKARAAVRAARRAEDIAHREAIESERMRLEQEVRMKELEMQKQREDMLKQREDEAKAEALRLRQEEDERIRAAPADYPVQEMMRTYLDPVFTQAGSVAARATAEYDALTQEVADEEATATVGTRLSGAFISIWAITVAANTVMTTLVLQSIMGWVAYLAAPALVLAPSAVMYWIRSIVERSKRGIVSKITKRGTIVVGVAALVLIGGLLFISAGARASFIYDSKIGVAELALEQLKDEDAPDAFEVQMQQTLLDDLKAERAKAAQTFEGLLPIGLALECLGAYYFSDFLSRRRLRALRRRREAVGRVRSKAEDTRQEMASATRSRVVQRLIELGLYNDEVLPLLDLNLGEQDEMEDERAAADRDDGNAVPEEGEDAEEEEGILTLDAVAAVRMQHAGAGTGDEASDGEADEPDDGAGEAERPDESYGDAGGNPFRDFILD
jgi:hypothetical protein